MCAMCKVLNDQVPDGLNLNYTYIGGCCDESDALCPWRPDSLFLHIQCNPVNLCTILRGSLNTKMSNK